YNVIDLGRDVDYGKLLDAVEKYYPCVLGLSALMTTTAQNMAKSIALVRAKYPDIKVIVGGAVLTKEFATQIGGIYCQDAMETVSQLEKLF
ncbi:MAG: cobalamin-dependent protein, partial [Clostridia bacterium]